jgi:RNA polymerase sigma-70 factor (ECF subfamily)
MDDSGTVADQELLAAAQRGDAAAVDKLLERVQPQIYGFGLRMCRHPQDAEDILQETLLSVARKLSEFRAESSLSTWLYTIARNHCLKKRRRGGKFAPARLEPLDAIETLSTARAGPMPGCSDPSTELETREAIARVIEALTQLEPAHREVIVLRDMEGLPAIEVAEVLGLSVPAVKSRLHRARKALREVIGTVPASPDCPDVVELFSRHAEEDLTPAACEAMQRHLATCSRCAGVCKALQHDLSMCQSAPAAQVPQTVQNRVRAALRATLRAADGPTSTQPGLPGRKNSQSGEP